MFFEVRVRIGDGPQEPLSKVLEDGQEHLLVVLYLRFRDFDLAIVELSLGLVHMRALF